MKWPSLQPWTPKSDWLPISSTGIILELNIRSWGEALEKLLMGSTNSLWRIWIPMLRCTRLKTINGMFVWWKSAGHLFTIEYLWLCLAFLIQLLLHGFLQPQVRQHYFSPLSAFPLLFPLFMKSNWFLCPALCSLDRFSSRPAISLSFLERVY